MDSDKFVGIVLSTSVVLIILMFTSCTYHTTKDHNDCVRNSKSVEIAKSCKIGHP